MAIDPSELLSEAQKTQPKVPYEPLASRYLESVEVLRSKGLTWNEITAWFKEKGLDFSCSALQSAWCKHRKKPAAVKSRKYAAYSGGCQGAVRKILEDLAPATAGAIEIFDFLSRQDKKYNIGTIRWALRQMLAAGDVTIACRYGNAFCYHLTGAAKETK